MSHQEQTASIGSASPVAFSIENPRRGEKRFLDFESNINETNDSNKSYQRLQFFKKESFGCCRKVMRAMLYDIIFAILLLIIGTLGMVTTEQIRTEVTKYFNDTTCDEYIITNTTEHADFVFYVSLAMVTWSILSILILYIFWRWTWNKLIIASNEPTQYLQFRKSIKHRSKMIFAMNLVIFFTINLVLFWSGTRFWRDVEDADNEACIADPTLDNLSDQLKYTLIPSFTVACAGGSAIIFASVACIYCPYGMECCGQLIGVKDEAKYRKWRRQKDKEKNNGSCSGGSCS